MTIESMGQQAKAAARILAQVSTEEKNAALQNIADRLWVEREAILPANQEDLAAAQAA
ncbi:MAG: gamma-glutamyl-phosphate reductase, partial [Chloroflexi bacterium]